MAPRKPKKNPRRLIAVFSVIALLAVALTFLWPVFFRKDFRIGLAAQLHVDPEFLHINIPPAPNRLPGAAFVLRGAFLSVLGPLDQTEITRGAEFSMDWSDLSASDAQSQLAGGLWGGIFSSGSDDKVKVQLKSGRVLEATTDQMKARLLGSESVRHQANSGFKPLVIVRAYEAILEMKIERGRKSQAEVWEKKVKLAKEADATGSGSLKLSESDDQKLVMEWKEPVVFAFEAVEASLIAEHLGSEPNKVLFHPVSPKSVKSALNASLPAASTEEASKKNG